jgi:hypothetical protein
MARSAYISAGVGALLAASAILVHYRTRRTERGNPPNGRFLQIDGVRLHYMDRGDGETLVLLHGNGMMLDDMTLSGLTDLASKKYRVIAFDRPGSPAATFDFTLGWAPYVARSAKEALRPRSRSEALRCIPSVDDTTAFTASRRCQRDRTDDPCGDGTTSSLWRARNAGHHLHRSER